MELLDLWNFTAQRRRDYNGNELRPIAIELSGLPREAQQYEPFKKSDGTLVYYDSSLFHHECVSHMKHLDAADFKTENMPVFTWTKEEEVNLSDYGDEKYPSCGWCDEIIATEPYHKHFCDKDKNAYYTRRDAIFRNEWKFYWDKLNEASE